MSENKKVIYLTARAENTPNDGEAMNAWLYFRKSVHQIPENISEQMESFREKCREHGFTIIGETFNLGGGNTTKPILEKLLEDEKSIKFMLSPTAATLARDAKECLELKELMDRHNVVFKSADTGFECPYSELPSLVAFMLNDADTMKLVNGADDDESEVLAPSL